MRIVYIGTGEIGLPAFRWLREAGHEIVAVYTQPDKPAGRKMELLPSAIKREALAHGLPVFQPRKIREAESVSAIAALAPDLIVVMAYGQILPKGILDAPRLACLNLHASLLPRHRGAAPIQSALLAGDAETGITVMYMAEGLDTGDILLKLSLRVRRHETGGSLHERLARATPYVLAESIHLLESGSAPRIPQDDAFATYAPKLTREHGLIDWSRPFDEIDRHIRAMNPWPGAFTFLTGRDGTPKKLKVFGAARNPRAHGAPGCVLRANARGLLVAGGAGALILPELQLEGKRRLAAREFLLGNPIPSGTKLG